MGVHLALYVDTIAIQSVNYLRAFVAIGEIRMGDFERITFLGRRVLHLFHILRKL